MRIASTTTHVGRPPTGSFLPRRPNQHRHPAHYLALVTRLVRSDGLEGLAGTNRSTAYQPFQPCTSSIRHGRFHLRTGQHSYIGGKEGPGERGGTWYARPSCADPATSSRFSPGAFHVPHPSWSKGEDETGCWPWTPRGNYNTPPGLKSPPQPTSVSVLVHDPGLPSAMYIILRGRGASVRSGSAARGRRLLRWFGGKERHCHALNGGGDGPTDPIHPYVASFESPKRTGRAPSEARVVLLVMISMIRLVR